MTIFLMVLASAGGYAASIYTWSTIKVWANGAYIEARALETRAAQLRANL
jgi:hypothetical protein